MGRLCVPTLPPWRKLTIKANTTRQLRVYLLSPLEKRTMIGEQ